jgi:hypothetical protein
MKRDQQSGQALIASMVMVVFIFALAGGLAVAASALLAQGSARTSVLTNDLLGQNQINAAVAWAAGRGVASNPAYCRTPTTLPALGPSGEMTGIQCLEVDNVAASNPGAVPLSWNGGNCSVTPFPVSGSRTFIWLNGSSGLSAFVDQSSGNGCVSGAGTICSTSGSGAPTQLALDCNLSSVGSPVLHVSASGRTPLAARYTTFASPFVQAPGSPRATPAGPAAMAVADLTGTGRLDLVVADAGTSKVSVFPGGPGDGSFQARADYSVGPNPSSLWVGDLNGDGKPDIVVGDSGASLVTVLLNSGNGTFSQRADYTVAGPPTAVVAGNFDGHGRADVAVTTSGVAHIEVLPNNGDGTFGSSIENPIPSVATAMASGDFNGNGKGDVAVVENGQVLVQMGNDGDGTFDSASGGPYSVGGTGPYSITSADVNGDGVPDLIVTNQTTGLVTVLLGSGSNGRFSQAPGSPFAAGAGVSSATVADFNSDGNPDLALVNAIANTVSVWNGRGDGSFSQDAGGSVPVGSFPSAVVAGDFNRDGSFDLAIADAGSSDITVLLANASRSSVFSFTAPIPGGFEEADLWISGNGQANQLTYEGKL